MNDDAFDAPKTRGTRRRLLESMCCFDGSCAVSRALLLGGTRRCNLPKCRQGLIGGWGWCDRA